MAESRDNPEIFWVDPTDRGLLPLDKFHISRSLARCLRKMPYHVTLNRDFTGVVAGCADREETWINEEIFNLYAQLHRKGYAHSLEVWDENTLIGGVYGVALGGAFFGESMFSRRPNASKIALAFLTKHLSNCGFALFDTQFITEHLASLCAEEIPRALYQYRLKEALLYAADIAEQPLPNVHSVMQRNTQTS